MQTATPSPVHTGPVRRQLAIDYYTLYGTGPNRCVPLLQGGRGRSRFRSQPVPSLAHSRQVNRAVDLQGHGPPHYVSASSLGVDMATTWPAF